MCFHVLFSLCFYLLICKVSSAITSVKMFVEDMEVASNRTMYPVPASRNSFRIKQIQNNVFADRRAAANAMAQEQDMPVFAAEIDSMATDGTPTPEVRGRRIGLGFSSAGLGRVGGISCRWLPVWLYAIFTAMCCVTFAMPLGHLVSDEQARLQILNSVAYFIIIFVSQSSFANESFTIHVC